jgi:hypothetical protein
MGYSQFLRPFWSKSTNTGVVDKVVQAFITKLNFDSLHSLINAGLIGGIHLDKHHSPRRFLNQFLEARGLRTCRCEYDSRIRWRGIRKMGNCNDVRLRSRYTSLSQKDYNIPARLEYA